MENNPSSDKELFQWVKASADKPKEELRSAEDIAEEYVKQWPTLTGIYRQEAIKNFIAGYNHAYHAQFTQVKVDNQVEAVRFAEENIHTWFELSYAQYLTIPRSIMEAMPMEWQYRMTKCLNELDEQIDWRPKEGRYWVQLKDHKGKYLHDPLREYRHPDTKFINQLKK